MQPKSRQGAKRAMKAKTRSDITAYIAEQGEARRADVYRSDVPHAPEVPHRGTTRGYTAEEKADLVKKIKYMRNRHASFLDISIAIDVSQSTVIKWYREAGESNAAA